MSLLEELESQGVTAEDLEKAASVRLFEKAAAAEGVDLDSLDVDQVEELYASFLSNQSYSDDYTKEASAMNDEIIDLFEKTAAAEGIDLDEMGDHELAELYNHYVENVLPEQMGEYEEVGEAHDKLAEAEILGRHMARAYMDEVEMYKEAVEVSPGVYKPLSKMTKAERAAYKAQGGSQVASPQNKMRGYTKSQRKAKIQEFKDAEKARQKGAKVKERIGKTKHALRGAGAHLRRNKALYGLGALGAAGTAGAYMAGRQQQKAASFEDYDFVDDLALEMAGEWLLDNGFLD